MAVSTYIILLFSIGVVLFLFGYQPLIYQVFNNSYGDTNSVVQVTINGIKNLFTDPLFLAALGVSIITSVFIGGGGGFSVFYIIPLLMFISLIGNTFILPSVALFNSGMPSPIAGFIVAFMNILMLLSIIEFIKGGPT